MQPPVERRVVSPISRRQLGRLMGHDFLSPALRCSTSWIKIDCLYWKEKGHFARIALPSRANAKAKEASVKARPSKKE
jgi:hypothetical protein